MVTKYLNRREFAEYIGVKPDTLNRYKLPPHDATIGNLKGWLPATIDAWEKRRPGSRRYVEEDWHLPPKKKRKR